MKRYPSLSAMVALPRFCKSLNPGKTLTPISNAVVCQLDRHSDGEREQIDPSQSRENLDARGNRTYISYYTAILTPIVYYEYTCFIYYVGAYINTDSEEE